MAELPVQNTDTNSLDLIFSALALEGQDLVFGAGVVGITPTSGDLNLKIPPVKLTIVGHFSKDLYSASLVLQLPYMQPRLSASYDVNTFRGLEVGVRQAFEESDQGYAIRSSLILDSTQLVEGFSTVFQESEPLAGRSLMTFEPSYTISTQAATFFEAGQPVKRYTFSLTQDAEKVSNRSISGYQQASVVPARLKGVRFQEGELVSLGSGVTAGQALSVSRRWGFSTKYSQQVNKSFDIFYQMAEYLINVTPPGILPEIPITPLDNPQNYNLEFRCLRELDPDSLNEWNHDITFKDCPPPTPPPILSVDYTEPYFVINTIDLINIETEEVIQATALDFSTDLSSFAWSGSMTVSGAEISKLTSPTNNPVKVALTFNGNLAVFMVQSITKAVSFNKASYKVDIISPTALLDSPYSRINSSTVTADAAPQTLITDMLTPQVTGISLDWQYLSALDWVVAANTFSYQELSPIKAIGKLLEGSAAFISSSLDGTKLVVKRKRVNEFWETAVAPLTLDTSLLATLSFSGEKHRNFDAVYVISGLGQALGITAHVVRDSGAGVELAPQIIAPTLTSPSSIRDAGKYALGKAGLVETRTLSQPIVAGNPLLTPADLVSFTVDGVTYIGSVLSTSVSLKFNSQYQNFVVEVVKGYA